MRLIEHHQVVGHHASILKPREHTVSRQGIDAGDEQVAPGTHERVASAGISAGDDAEGEIEERAHLVFPVAHQARRRHNQHARDEPAREHFADVQPGHDGFARSGIIGQ